MKPRTVRLFNRTVPLIPLIIALILGAVFVGYTAANGLEFLKLIKKPAQQTTYHEADTIIIGVIPEYIDAQVTLEGEVNAAGEFAIGRQMNVSLAIHSLREGFLVSDYYTLNINGTIVLSGLMVDVAFGTPHTATGTFTPSAAGTIPVSLNIIDMEWTKI